MSGSSSKVFNGTPDIGPGRASILWTYAVLTIAVFLFAVATTYSLFKLRDKSEVADIHSQATIWLVVSFVHEFRVGEYRQGYYRFSEDKRGRSNDG